MGAMTSTSQKEGIGYANPSKPPIDQCTYNILINRTYMQGGLNGILEAKKILLFEFYISELLLLNGMVI